MNLKEAMAALEAAGTEKNRMIYARHGAPPDRMFGVNYGFIEKLAREIRKDHALARQLWATGNSDAQMLAAYIGNGATMSGKELDEWAVSLSWYGLADALVSRLAVYSPDALPQMRKWLNSRGEMTQRCGYAMVSCILRGGKGLPKLEADELGSVLESIEKQIHKAPNRAREAMNGTLIAIGMWGGSELKEQALAAANRIGEVYIDHGETGCKTPDARTYINKTAPGKAASAAAKTAGKTAASKGAAKG